MATESEAILVQRAKSGSHDAYGRLVLQHQVLVRAFLGRYLRDDNEVDELAQRVFVSAYGSLAGFRGESKFSSWLVSIARREVAMYIRSEQRRRRRESIAAEKAIAQWTNLAPQSQEPSEKLAALAECLKQLPDNSQDVIRRFYFEREAVETIAAAQSRSCGAIRTMLLRIRQSLSTCVSSRLAAAERM